MLWRYFILNFYMTKQSKSISDDKKQINADQVKEAALKEKNSGKHNDVNDDSLVIKNNPDCKST